MISVEHPADISGLFSEGVAVRVRGSSAVFYVCDFKACLPRKSCWTVLKKTQSVRQIHTLCPSLTQCYTPTDTYKDTHCPHKPFSDWSLLVVEQQKPDEASPHTRCTLLSVCPSSVFLSQPFPIFPKAFKIVFTLTKHSQVSWTLLYFFIWCDAKTVGWTKGSEMSL